MRAKAVIKNIGGTDKIIGYKIKCLGCECEHVIYTLPGFYNVAWKFNGDVNKPTFSPSLKCTTGSLAQPGYIDEPGIPPTCCHSFIRNGQIQYLNDCTHFLKGQTVNLPETCIMLEQNEVIDKVHVELSDPQLAFMACRMAITLNMAGQGSGKSHIIGLMSGMLINNFPRIRGFIGANTYDQLSTATLKASFDVWRNVFGFTQYDPHSNPAGSYVVDRRPPKHWERFLDFKSWKNVISFFNGCVVFTGSLENYEAQDGKEFGWAELDETKDTKEEAVKDVILGRLRQIGLWFDAKGDLHYNPSIRDAQAKGLTAWNPLHIHTSPASGLVTWVNDWFDLGTYREEIRKKCEAKETDYFYKENTKRRTCAIIYSAYHNAPNLAPGYFEIREANMSPEKVLKLIHGYPFSKSGGEYFTEFHSLLQVRETPFLPEAIPQLTWDFNVMPYMTCEAFQIQFIRRYLGPNNTKSDTPEIGWRAIEVMQIRFYKEYCFESPRNRTDAICEQFKADHPVITDIFFYGDASGAKRIEGLGHETNYGYIEDSLEQYVTAASRRVKGNNVQNLKRRDLLNDIFAGRIPEVEIVIDPSCEKLIMDLENVKLGPEGKVKAMVTDEETGARYQLLGHTSDAIEYAICWLASDYMK